MRNGTFAPGLITPAPKCDQFTLTSFSGSLSSTSNFTTISALTSEIAVLVNSCPGHIGAPPPNGNQMLSRPRDENLRPAGFSCCSRNRSAQNRLSGRTEVSQRLGSMCQVVEHAIRGFFCGMRHSDGWRHVGCEEFEEIWSVLPFVGDIKCFYSFVDASD